MGHSHAAEDGHDLEQTLATESKRYHHFVTLALWLAVITAFEVVLIYLPFSDAAILTTLIILSVFKFFAVIAWFMHIIYDRPLLVYVFMSGLVIACATVAALMLIFSPTDMDPLWIAVG